MALPLESVGLLNRLAGTSFLVLKILNVSVAAETDLLRHAYATKRIGLSANSAVAEGSLDARDIVD